MHKYEGGRHCALGDLAPSTRPLHAAQRPPRQKGLEGGEDAVADSDERQLTQITTPLFWQEP